MLVVCQNNELICKIPSDQKKFMDALKQIIAKQKQQQQQRVSCKYFKYIEMVNGIDDGTKNFTT